MANHELKTMTPDSSFDMSAAVAFGADDQSAAAPSVWLWSTIWSYLKALENTWTAKQTFSVTPVIGSNNVLDASTGEPLGQVVGDSLQTSDHTLVLTDKGKRVRMNVATANSLTIPPNEDVAFPLNSRVEVYQWGAGQTTIAAGDGVTIRSADGYKKIRRQYSAVVLDKIAEDEWLIAGDLES